MPSRPDSPERPPRPDEPRATPAWTGTPPLPEAREPLPLQVARARWVRFRGNPVAWLLAALAVAAGSRAAGVQVGEWAQAVVRLLGGE